MIADSIFGVIGEIGVAGTVNVLDRLIILCALIGVFDQEGDRRPGRELLPALFIIKDTREDFDLIFFLPLSGEARCTRAAQIEKRLNIFFLERNSGRAAIQHTANRRPVALAKGRDAEEMAEAVVGHGCINA